MSLVDNGAHFNYGQLEPGVAELARKTADRVRGQIRKSIRAIIEIGNELIAMKEQLSHGEFGAWIRSEFGWTDRTARNFMAVAEHLGDKTEIISDSHITPTAAYLLAAPSTPEVVRSKAILLGAGGTKITQVLVRELVAEHRKRPKGKRKGPTPDRLQHQLKLLLHRIRKCWDPQDLASMAEILTRFTRHFSLNATDSCGQTLFIVWAGR
jgi:hypothetical protein